MKILAFFCLIALAIVSAEECGEERAETCEDSLLDALLRHATETEICRELKRSVICYRSAVDDCLDGEINKDVEERLPEIEKWMREKCEEGGAIPSAEGCGIERIGTCEDSLLDALLRHATEIEICRELRSSVICIRRAVDDCHDDERERELDMGEVLQKQEKFLREKCEGGVSIAVDDGMIKCLKENKGYIHECTEEATDQTLSSLTGENVDGNTLQCLMYPRMAHCYVARIRDKCGNEAAKLTQKDMSNVPEEVQQACEESGNSIAFRFHDLEDRKRK